MYNPCGVVLGFWKTTRDWCRADVWSGNTSWELLESHARLSQEGFEEARAKYAIHVAVIIAEGALAKIKLRGLFVRPKDFEYIELDALRASLQRIAEPLLAKGIERAMLPEPSAENWTAVSTATAEQRAGEVVYKLTLMIECAAEQKYAELGKHFGDLCEIAVIYIDDRIRYFERMNALQSTVYTTRMLTP